VQDAVEPLGEGAAEPPLVEQTAPREPRLFGDGPPLPLREVIENYRLVPGLDEPVATTLPM
jgi:hypothetical protein